MMADHTAARPTPTLKPHYGDMPCCNCGGCEETEAMPAPSLDPQEEYRRRQRSNIIAIAIVAALVVGSIILLVVLQHGIKQETCFAAGPRGCAAIDEHQ